MSRKVDIKKLIKGCQRRLQKLKEQQAIMGLNTPPHILTEIEDIEAEIEELQKELKELEKDEPNYSIIWSELRKGRVVPFLGSGASFDHELVHCLADKIEFSSDVPCDRDDLAQVASYCVAEEDRSILLSCLCEEVFKRGSQVGKIHYFLADLVDLVDVPLLITTNYDDLIEHAFKLKSKPFHLVMHPTDSKDWPDFALWWKSDADKPEYYKLNEFPPWLEDTNTIIYKMHGGVDPQTKKCNNCVITNCVITEEDHVKFLACMTRQSAIPVPVSFRLHRRRFLFLGYGLYDWNLRVLLKYLKAKPISSKVETASNEIHMSTSEDLRSWAIQDHPSKLEKTFWGAYQVKLYDRKIDDFVDKMRTRML